jgi:hypothetical protein
MADPLSSTEMRIGPYPLSEPLSELVAWFAEVLADPEWIRAVGSLAWPVLVGLVLLLFRDELRRLMSRLRRGTLFGSEFELADALEEIHQGVEVGRRELVAAQAADDASEAEPIRDGSVGEPPRKPTPEAEPASTRGGVDKVREVASVSPSAGLMLLGAAVEEELRRVADDLGVATDRRYLPVSHLAQQLLLEEHIPTALAISVRRFWDVRNQVVHGRDRQDEEVLSVIERGIEVLLALQLIRRPRLSEQSLIHILFAALRLELPQRYDVLMDVGIPDDGRVDLLLRHSTPDGPDVLVEVKRGRRWLLRAERSRLNDRLNSYQQSYSKHYGREARLILVWFDNRTGRAIEATPAWDAPYPLLAIQTESLVDDSRSVAREVLAAAGVTVESPDGPSGPPARPAE